MNAIVQDIRTIRANFLRRAVVKVRALIAEGDFEDARRAADELGRYFEWVKADFMPETEERLADQINTLRDAIHRMARESLMGRKIGPAARQR